MEKVLWVQLQNKSCLLLPNYNKKDRNLCWIQKKKKTHIKTHWVLCEEFQKWAVLLHISKIMLHKKQNRLLKWGLILKNSYGLLKAKTLKYKIEVLKIPQPNKNLRLTIRTVRAWINLARSKLPSLRIQPLIKKQLRMKKSKTFNLWYF